MASGVARMHSKVRSMSRNLLCVRGTTYSGGREGEGAEETLDEHARDSHPLLVDPAARKVDAPLNLIVVKAVLVAAEWVSGGSHFQELVLVDSAARTKGSARSTEGMRGGSYDIWSMLARRAWD